jgi:hypothetical protein
MTRDLILIALGLALLLTVLFMSPGGCRSTPNSGLRTVEMLIGGRTFILEVADTDGDRQMGLMNRDALPAGHGMIFVFDRERPQGFWMKNTRIPLDILFLDKDGKIVSIHTMKPYDLNTTQSAGPAKYAIELNAGVASRLGLKPGDQLEIPSSAREPRG